ncbi:MAG: restriction endonuclease subunit S [Lachnospiraceae bacterium]|nr:restriction endonuclease subunit S [Lachnospiraceae bacterium]
MTKLTDLCDIQYGYAFDSGAFTDDESYPQLVRIRDVKRGYSETYYNGEYPEEYVLSAGDLLIGMDGEFNIARWKVDGALLNQRVCKIIVKDNADEEFLRFALSKALKAIEDRTSFATVKHLSAKELNKLEIPVPPYEEQKKISEILHRLEKVIDIRQNELASLDELIKARFVELFGDMADSQCKWDKCKLIDACADSNDIKCGPFGTQLGKDEYTDSGVEVWEIPQINSEFKTMPTHFVTKEKAQNLEQYSIRPGDIAMSRKGNVGRCAVFPESFEEGIIHSDVLRIRVDGSRVAPEFMMRQLHYSGDIQHQIELVSSGAIMAGINVTKLKDICVYVPPKTLQDEFVSFVKQVDKSKVAVKKALDETQTLFDSLMQEYFG